MSLRRSTIFVSAILALFLISPNIPAQSILQKANLYSYAEDLTFVSRGPRFGQIAVLQGHEVFGVPMFGRAQAKKLFDLRNVPSQYSTGIAFVESMGLYVVNDPLQKTPLYFVHDSGQLISVRQIQYPTGYQPEHLEGLTYIPFDAPSYWNHLVMVAVDPGSIQRRLLVINLDSQVVSEIPLDLSGASAVGVAFQPPNRLLVTAAIEWQSALALSITALDFAGNILAGPTVVNDTGRFYEGVVCSLDGRVYLAGEGGKLLALGYDLDRQPSADRTYMKTLGLTNPRGLTWDSDRDQHIFSHRRLEASTVELTAVPFDLRGIASTAPLPQEFKLSWSLSFLPDLHLIAMPRRGFCPLCSIGLFTSDGGLAGTVDLSGLDLGPANAISYIPSTHQFVATFPPSKNLYVVSFEGSLVRTIDLTSTLLSGPAAVTFFNPTHPTGGQFLILESPGGGVPTGTHRAIVTDFYGGVLAEFDYLDTLGVWFPGGISEITTGPFSGAFSVLDQRGGWLTVFRLNALVSGRSGRW